MNEHPFRRYHTSDMFISHVDKALQHIFVRQHSQRPYPAQQFLDQSGVETVLSNSEKKAVIGMMRVNHAGEMAAQALYHGQGLIARDHSLKDKLHHASVEESDHLNWCRRRLDALNAKPSRLDPLWYAGSFSIGMIAGIAGDQWNLGFLSETEKQVVRHLDAHLERLPQHDAQTRAVVQQMRTDELGHAQLADDLGAAVLPKPVKLLMRFTAKVMTILAAKI
ncbi:MAG: 2-polyprenyl-3-methyl-6-methoxy-1,4-benzoquinone monooxygenase [Mariprofundaceae bacterium]|nr:2-polyprenyl-3-methyl-6-methoxy-1,4-benzoquinone monooxygenase [Mariprofundaceae bacterium]